MDHLDNIRRILASTLQLRDQGASLSLNTPLLGSISELDSMAVVTILTAIEDHYGFEVVDDEISADLFESVGTLVDFVSAKCE